MTQPGGAGLFGSGGTVQQLFWWQVVGQLISAALAPFATGLEYLVWSAPGNQTAKHSPAELADMVIRGIMTEQEAAGEAMAYGINQERFHQSVLDTGEVPSPLDLARMLFRGIIPEGPSGAGSVSYADGFRESRLRTEWMAAVKDYSRAVPSPGDAVSAQQRAQLTPDEARAEYLKLGGHPDYYDLMLHLAGEPISVGEAARLAYRGFIPWEGTGADVVSVQQAVFEGRTKDKYWQYIKQLTQYYPPPRTITAMVREGGLTKEQAIGWWQAAGMDAATAEIYWANAGTAKTTKPKETAESTTLKLYADHIIDAATATGLLAALGYDAAEAAFILEVQDATLYEANVSAATSHIRSLYLALRMTKADAVGLLGQLGVATDQVSQIVNLWDAELAATVKLLTEPQIVDAWEFGIITGAEALTQLQALGYAPYAAWVLLATKNQSSTPGGGKGYDLPTAPAPTALITPLGG